MRSALRLVLTAALLAGSAPAGAQLRAVRAVPGIGLPATPVRLAAPALGPAAPSLAPSLSPSLSSLSDAPKPGETFRADAARAVAEWKAARAAQPAGTLAPAAPAPSRTAAETAAAATDAIIAAEGVDEALESLVSLGVLDKERLPEGPTDRLALLKRVWDGVSEKRASELLPVDADWAVPALRVERGGKTYLIHGVAHGEYYPAHRGSVMRLVKQVRAQGHTLLSEQRIPEHYGFAYGLETLDHVVESHDQRAEVVKAARGLPPAAIGAVHALMRYGALGGVAYAWARAALQGADPLSWALAAGGTALLYLLYRGMQPLNKLSVLAGAREAESLGSPHLAEQLRREAKAFFEKPVQAADVRRLHLPPGPAASSDEFSPRSAAMAAAAAGATGAVVHVLVGYKHAAEIAWRLAGFPAGNAAPRKEAGDVNGGKLDGLHVFYAGTAALSVIAGLYFSNPFVGGALFLAAAVAQLFASDFFPRRSREDAENGGRLNRLTGVAVAFMLAGAAAIMGGSYLGLNLVTGGGVALLAAAVLAWAMPRDFSRVPFGSYRAGVWNGRPARWYGWSLSPNSFFQSAVLGALGGPIVYGLMGGSLLMSIGGMALAPLLVDLLKPTILYEPGGRNGGALSALATSLLVAAAGALYAWHKGTVARAVERSAAPRALSLKELYALNIAGMALSVAMGVYLGSLILGLVGLYLLPIPVIFGYVALRRVSGDAVKWPGLRYDPRVTWHGKRDGPSGRNGGRVNQVAVIAALGALSLVAGLVTQDGWFYVGAAIWLGTALLGMALNRRRGDGNGGSVTGWAIAGLVLGLLFGSIDKDDGWKLDGPGALVGGTAGLLMAGGVAAGLTLAPAWYAAAAAGLLLLGAHKWLARPRFGGSTALADGVHAFPDARSARKAFFGASFTRDRWAAQRGREHSYDEDGAMGQEAMLSESFAAATSDTFAVLVLLAEPDSLGGHRVVVVDGVERVRALRFEHGALVLPDGLTRVDLRSVRRAVGYAYR